MSPAHQCQPRSQGHSAARTRPQAKGLHCAQWLCQIDCAGKNTATTVTGVTKPKCTASACRCRAIQQLCVIGPGSAQSSSLLQLIAVVVGGAEAAARWRERDGPTFVVHVLASMTSLYTAEGCTSQYLYAQIYLPALPCMRAPSETLSVYYLHICRTGGQKPGSH